MPEVTIPVGPQHPALKEPANFMVTVDGETIVDAELSIAYTHRGMEKAAEDRAYLQIIYLAERICGICSHSHSTCFTQGVEELSEIEVPDRGLYLRTLVAELERIHSHMLWLGIAGHEIGFDTLWHYTWRDRELVMDLLEMITGNRCNYAMNTIGGVRRDITKEQGKEVLKRLDTIEKRVEYYKDLCSREDTVLLRCEGVGLVPEKVAKETCAVGPTARASNVATDVRKEDPYAAYDKIDFYIVVLDLCDLLGRVLVRVMEAIECCRMCRQLIKELPSGPVRAMKKPFRRRVSEDEAVSRYEAPRGENIHYIRSDGTRKPERWKVRAPTMANWPSVVHALKGSYIADIPIVVAGIDPCMSCTSRMAVAMKDESSGKERVMIMEELRRYGIKWYEENEGTGKA